MSVQNIIAFVFSWLNMCPYTSIVQMIIGSSKGVDFLIILPIFYFNFKAADPHTDHHSP